MIHVQYAALNPNEISVTGSHNALYPPFFHDNVVVPSDHRNPTSRVVVQLIIRAFIELAPLWPAQSPPPPESPEVITAQCALSPAIPRAGNPALT